MKKEIRIAYQIKQNDTLLKIANCFETTVHKILEDNKHIQMGKLRTGELISVLPGSIHFVNSVQEPTETEREVRFEKLTEHRLEEMLFWTHAYIVSRLENNDDTSYVETRMLQVPESLANVLKPYYTEEQVNKIRSLLYDHFLSLIRLLNALKIGLPSDYDFHNNKLYENAADLAKALSEMNPYYNQQELQNLLYGYLDLIKKIASNRFNQTYLQEIQNIDKAREQILVLSQYITDGVVEQFPDRF